MLHLFAMLTLPPTADINCRMFIWPPNLSYLSRFKHPQSSWLGFIIPDG